MVRCPVCASSDVVLVVSSNGSAFCTACGARWIQDGVERRDVRSGPRPDGPPAAHEDEERFAVDWA
jgi:hypothetical protein